jgi:hypothetical protein
MFAQPTGTHFLDSGGATGRRWQQLEHVDAAAYWQRPAVAIASSGYGDTANALGTPPELTISTAHALAACVEVDAGAANGLDVIAKAYPSATWFDIAEDWRELLPSSAECGETWNTYNFETLGDTVLQGYTYQLDGDDTARLIVQSHNGADVRGGYSAPHAYRFARSGSSSREWLETCLLVMLTDCYVSCTACTFAASVRACWELDVLDAGELDASAEGCESFNAWPHWRGSLCPSCHGDTLAGELEDPASF